MFLPTRRCRRARLLAPFFVALTGLMSLGVATAAAQPFDFLMNPVPDISGSPPPGVAAVFEITLNLDGLQFAPDEVRIVLPAPDGQIIAAKRAFDPIDGFDSNGVPQQRPEDNVLRIFVYPKKGLLGLAPDSWVRCRGALQ